MDLCLGVYISENVLSRIIESKRGSNNESQIQNQRISDDFKV